MAAKYRVTFVTDEQTEQKIKQIAQTEGKSVSGMIGQLVDEYLGIDWSRHKELSRIGSICGFKPVELVNKMYDQKIRSFVGSLADA
jgi:hypothetical protein